MWQWFEPLTDPGDLVVDPFCGSGEWGHIIAAMGRRWIGADVEEGGSLSIVE
jgi:DNA modification methylase